MERERESGLWRERGKEKEGGAHTHTHTHTHARMHARTHPPTHTPTHARTHTHMTLINVTPIL